jgi:hypothetical protein
VERAEKAITEPGLDCFVADATRKDAGLPVGDLTVVTSLALKTPFPDLPPSPATVPLPLRVNAKVT